MILRNGKHYLTNRPPTKIGRIIENLNREKQYRKEDLIKDRGQRIYEIHDVLSFPEFKKYYAYFFTYEFTIRTTMREDDDEWTLGFAYAFVNELMFNLMREEGVSYEAAINLVPNTIHTDGIDDFINLDDTKLYIYETFKDIDLDVYFYFRDKLNWLYEYANEIAKAEDFNFNN